MVAKSCRLNAKISPPRQASPFEGKEFKVDFLWNREAELERTGWEEEE